MCPEYTSDVVVVNAVRLSVVYSDYRYMVARQCFDYSNSLGSADEISSSASRSCPVERSSLVVYSKLPDVLTSVVEDLLTVARLPPSCADRLHRPRRDEGCLPAALTLYKYVSK